MKRMETPWWIFYIAEDACFDDNKVGKWMYFFYGVEGANFVDNVCKEVVEKELVKEAKYTNPLSFGLNPNASRADSGVACFYLNIDDMEGHRKIINYFIEHNMIQKTKAGKFYNIPFKLDKQTTAGEYGKAFVSKLNLDMFIDLSTGEWK